MSIPEYVEELRLNRRLSAARPAPSRARDWAQRSASLTLTWVGLDFLSGLVGGLIAFRIRLGPQPPETDPVGLLAAVGSVFPLVSVAYVLLFSVYLVVFARLYGLYRAPETRSALNEQRMTMQATLTAGLLLCGTLYVMRGIAVSRIVVALTIVFTMGLLMVRRALWRKVRERRFLEGHETRNVLIVGGGKVGQALRNHLGSLQQMGFRFLGFVALDEEDARNGDSQVIGTIDQCVELARSLFVDQIYFSTPADRQTVLRVVDQARLHGIEVRVVPDLYDGLAWNAPVEYIGQFPTIPLHLKQFPRGAYAFKRALDLVAGSVLSLLLLPLLALVALLIKLDSPGPVFYRAERIGRKGREFECLKFRTMVEGAESMQASIQHMNERDGVLFKMYRDPRITRIGRWLRRYSVDELPQLWNVLGGEMSLVGPRPPLAREVERYDLDHLRRLEVLPGITGLWQVEARQDPSFDNYISLDTAYVEHWTLLLDLKILVKTLGVVLSGTGV